MVLFGAATRALNVGALDGFDLGGGVENVEAGGPEGVEEHREGPAMRVRVGDDGSGAGLQNSPNLGRQSVDPIFPLGGGFARTELRTSSSSPQSSARSSQLSQTRLSSEN